MIKQKVLTLFVLLMTAVTGAWATDSHWPDFNPHYEGSEVLVAGITIDGVIITAEYDGWNQLEVAAFVGNECRSAGESVNYLYNGYVVEYGDPFPVLDGMKLYFNGEGGETVTFKMYNHATGVEYTACAVTFNGEETSILTGEEHSEGWSNPETPIFLNFTTPAAPTDPDYTVSMKESTEDAAKWQGKAGEGEYQALPLTGLDAGTAVTVKYNGTKKVKSVKAKKKAAAAKTLAEATAEDLGKIAGADGNIYDTKADAEAASTTAVAMIAYVGTASDCLHGLAIALADESGKYKYGEAVTACSGKAAVTGGTWRLPSEKDWQYMFIGCGSSESYSAPTWEMENSYSGLASKLATAQGEALQSDYYWSSTEYNSSDAWDFSFDEGKWFHSDKSIEDHVRACLAF